jgi:hypothetical protein
MNSPSALKEIRSRPAMYFAPVDFDVAAAFVGGFDLASNGGALAGFEQWLIVRVGKGNNLAWSSLVLHLIFPESRSPRQQLAEIDDHTDTVDKLFRILDEFWTDREAPEGLRRILLRYESWLRQQEWYDASSPQYVADGDITKRR